MKRILIRYGLIFLIALNSTIAAQELQVSGTVYAFHSEKLMLIKKASKNLGFEGPTADVKITVTGKSDTKSIQTDISGNYLFVLPSPGEYTVVVSKQGHSELGCVIDYKDAGTKTRFSLVSFVIRKDDNSKNALGSMSITDGGNLSYKFSETRGGNQDVIQSNKILLEKAVTLNNSSKQDIVSNQNSRSGGKPLNSSKETATEKKSDQHGDSALMRKANKLVSSLNNVLDDSIRNIAEARKQIDIYKSMLAAVQPTDPNYELLFNQIRNAEAQLALKERYLKIQASELSQARKTMTFMIIMLVIAAVLIGFMVYYLRERKKFNTELSGKNKQIARINTRLLSSIKYASVIQSNLLMDRAVLKDLFPNSFIYYQPKDYLSGDFYWFGASGSVKIIISADCTGHGVPGALLTVLGHGIIEQLIEKKKLSTPSAVINELNAQLNKAFSNHDLVEYGIELTVLCIDPKGTQAKFASNGHGIYKHSDDGLVRYLPVINKPVKREGQIEYLDMPIDFKKGDCFILMSDGYCDQFKHVNGKPEKYNIPRFENLLKKVLANQDISWGETELGKELTEWKGNGDQTDDVLVIGIRV